MHKGKQIGYSASKMKSILEGNKNDVALFIGNGINRYNESSNTNSWDDLLMELAERLLPSKLENVPKGVSLTEFYDLLELQCSKSTGTPSLQKEFCTLMKTWEWQEQHERIVKWAICRNAPILTTNFEKTLSSSAGCEIHRVKSPGFNKYYPWESYYGVNQLQNPEEEFAIWHINGMERYPASIRLGLTHYMGSVQRVRTWLHRGRKNRLFSGSSLETWKGRSTWLQVVFKKPLVIFGLQLDENEVFIRWLLLERARYYLIFPELVKPCWYIHVGPINDAGKKYFLEGVGVDTRQVNTYEEIYGPSVWQL